MSDEKYMPNTAEIREGYIGGEPMSVEKHPAELVWKIHTSIMRCGAFSPESIGDSHDAMQATFAALDALGLTVSRVYSVSVGALHLGTYESAEEARSSRHGHHGVETRIELVGVTPWEVVTDE